MSDSPSISVIIPAHDATAFIERAVKSALAQTIADLEVVIASDDGLDYAAFLREQGLSDSRVRCVSTGVLGGGPARARNTALDAARGRVIAALDADDTMAPEALSRLCPKAIEHGAAYARMRVVDHATGEELPSLDRPLLSGVVGLHEILTSQIHSYAGVVFDRQRVRARWPASKERWEDVQFYASCFDDVDGMFHDAAPLYVYHRREGSICNRPETGAEYHEAAERLIGRIEGGDSLGIQSASAREVYARFLRRALRLEAMFLEDMAAGRCVDYRDFVAQRIAEYYRLD